MTPDSETVRLQEFLEEKRRESRATVPDDKKVLIPTAEAGIRACIDCGTDFEYQAFKTRGGFLVSGERCENCYLVWRNTQVSPSVTDPTVLTPGTRIEKVLEAMDKLGCNVRRHGHLKLGELKDSPAKTAAAQFVHDILSAGKYREVRGLYIYGPPGTGKSQIAVSIVREVLERGVHPARVVYDRARAMITQLQDCYGTSSVDAFSEIRRRALLWIYEDAGTEKLTPDAYRILEDIIDRREGHPTLITSNLSRGDMATRWRDIAGWERFESRLLPFRAAAMTGADQRYRD